MEDGPGFHHRDSDSQNLCVLCVSMVAGRDVFSAVAGPHPGEDTQRLVRPAGFEPTAFGSGGQRSIQLSYGRIQTLARVAENLHNPIEAERTMRSWSVRVNNIDAL